MITQEAFVRANVDHDLPLFNVARQILALQFKRDYAAIVAWKAAFEGCKFQSRRARTSKGIDKGCLEVCVGRS